MAGVGQSAVFGKRKEPHTIIIARGDKIRHFTVRPWIAAVAGSAVALASVGYLVATSYLVFRDDLIGASAERQAQMQREYENRIAALREQVDRITSRQMLDQKLVESKVSELIERQSQLRKLDGRLSSIGDPRLAAPETSPTPQEKPDIRATLEPHNSFAGASEASSILRGAEPSKSAADRADIEFVALNTSLRTIENEQLAQIDALTESTYQAVEGISEALAATGADAHEDATGLGGPYFPPVALVPFDAKARELDNALDRLEALKSDARSLPLAHPAKGHAISSTFGIRKDPLLGTPAMHSGIDFKAALGSIARDTASGKVVKAGWNGGYGQMIEIDHGNGFSTRYAHLSRIEVAEGDTVSANQPIGEVGSTGRSTGPHLHYEVWEHGAAVDPLRFLKAGKRIARFL